MKSPGAIVHHHFEISVSRGNVRDLRATQDLLLSTGFALSPAVAEEEEWSSVGHEHRFHHLEEGDDVETLKARLRGAEEGKRHVFYEAFRSIESKIESPLAAGLEDVASIRRCLRRALRLELATIPPYIYALYSLCDQKSSCAQLLRSVAAEEMLHAGLVANLLVALGGVPTFFDERTGHLLYPLELEHMRGGMSLSLLPFGHEAVQQFLVLEKPSGDVNDLTSSQSFARTGEFDSIGALYAAVEGALERLHRSSGGGLFRNPRPELQMTARNYKVVEHNVPESGGLIPIRSMADARAAIATIVNQGEGRADDVFADEGRAELTHFHKLKLCQERLSVEAVHAGAPTNPKMADCADPGVAVVARLFNAAYACLLLTLQEMYLLMEKVMRPAGLLLFAKGFGPTFEAVDFGATRPVECVKDLARQALALFPKDLGKLDAGLAKLE